MKPVKSLIQASIATLVGKSIFAATNALHLGGGTAAPGLYALKIFPEILSYYLRQIPQGSIVITGTNGKTTTSRIISHYFSQQNIPIIHNRAGSNLERGLVSSLIKYASIAGEINDFQYGVWEVDEAEFSRSIEKIQPHTVVLLNLFRDQLDRYGEVEATRQKWHSALLKLSPNAQIIYNGDDPQLAFLMQSLKQTRPELKMCAFGIQGTDTTADNLLDPLTLVLCPQCNNKLRLTASTIAGQGSFICAICTFTNPDYAIRLTQLQDTASGLEAQVTSHNHTLELTTQLNGLFNGYNFAAAITTLNTLSSDHANIVKSCATVQNAFGRLEHIKIGTKELIICLIKNPTGASEIMKTVFHESFHSTSVLFVLNDNFADGKDVSWIWDCAFPAQSLKNLCTLYVTGTRRYDMALRLEHAVGSAQTISVLDSLEKVLAQFRKDTTPEIIPVLTTYTAMVELQKILENQSVKKKYWEE